MAHFHRWQKHAPAGIELVPLCPPGRESRHAEPLQTSLDALIDDLFGRIELTDEYPIGFLGHSMGALVGFALARMLCRVGYPPALFIAAACRAPHIGPDNPPLHQLEDSKLIEQLTTRYGNDPAVFERPEARRLFLPIVQADLQAIETYQTVDLDPLPCPIVAVGGKDDRSIRSHDLEKWRAFTDDQFELVTRPGGHFFVHADRDWFLDRFRSHHQQMV